MIIKIIGFAGTGKGLLASLIEKKLEVKLIKVDETFENEFPCFIYTIDDMELERLYNENN